MKVLRASLCLNCQCLAGYLFPPLILLSLATALLSPLLLLLCSCPAPPRPHLIHFPMKTFGFYFRFVCFFDANATQTMPSAGGGARNVLKRLHGMARGAAEGAVGAGRKQGEQQERGSRRETPQK